VLKFLSQIQPQDHAALYALGAKLTILQDFTTDASNLAAALGRYKNNPAVTTQSPDIQSITGPAPPGINVAQLNAAITFANVENPGWGNVIAMQDLAKQTGGRAFYNTNDIMTSIQRAVTDGDNSYVLGYYPDHRDWKGEFRKLKVTVDKPGLKVRARQRYFAIPELHEKTKDLQEKLGRIAMSPLDASGISMTSQIAPIPTNAAREIKLTLGFDPRGVQFTADAGREAAALQYALLQLDQTGKILTAVENPLPINISMAQYAVGLKQGMSFSLVIPLFSNAEELSLILRDSATGAAGSLPIPLEKYQRNAKN
jgi:hypothetical protein